MLKTQSSRRGFVLQAASTLALPLLVGCGAFKNAVNDRIDPIANPGNLDGKQFPVLVKGGAGAVLSGIGAFAGPFPDIAPVNRQNLLTFAEFTQNLRGEVQLVPSPSSPTAELIFPARIVVRRLSLTVRLYEAGAAEAAATREVAIPELTASSDNLVFVRVPDTNRYQWDQSGEIRLGSVRVGGDDAKRLFALLTSAGENGSNTNFVSASLSVVADVNGVGPVDAALLFTFGKGEARVGI